MPSFYKRGAHVFARRVRAIRGASVAAIDDLLAGEVKGAHAAAVEPGVKVGMSGREALDCM